MRVPHTGVPGIRFLVSVHGDKDEPGVGVALVGVVSAANSRLGGL